MSVRTSGITASTEGARFAPWRSMILRSVFSVFLDFFAMSCPPVSQTDDVPRLQHAHGVAQFPSERRARRRRGSGEISEAADASPVSLLHLFPVGLGERAR